MVVQRAIRTMVIAGFAAASLSALAGCGGAPPPDLSTPETVEGQDNVDFSIARARLEKPCTLISIRDAQNLTGRAYYETIAQNRVDGPRIRCAMGVGEGGLNGVVQLDIYQGDALVKAESLFAEQCQKGYETPPTIAENACRTPESAYAAQIGDVVVVALVRRDPGQANQALSLRLLDLVTPRVAALAPR